MTDTRLPKGARLHRLLRALQDARGEVVTSAELVTLIYGVPPAGDGRQLIADAVRRLRCKGYRISAQRGVGYWLEGRI